jgi:hypothetical protein
MDNVETIGSYIVVGFKGSDNFGVDGLDGAFCYRFLDAEEAELHDGEKRGF